MLLVTSAFAFAGAPAHVQVAFKKMYPKAVDVDWSQKGDYYVGDFMMNGFEKDVWMNANAQWVMTETDWGTLDQVSPNVYNAFSMGQYSAWQVDDVTFVEFPKSSPVVVVKVQQYNEQVEYQLFYAKDGSLLRTRNVSYGQGILWPNLFGID